MIRIGDRIRECKYGVIIESVVITKPIKNERGQLEFKSKLDNGEVISYMKHESSLAIVNK